MEHICISQEPRCEWKFDSTNATYILYDENDRVRARIRGGNLLNPDDIEDPVHRRNLTQQVGDLWQHWSGVRDAYTDGGL